MEAIITIEQSEECELFKDVYINGKCKGTVMADESMTPLDCWESLKNNWAIDDLEGIEDDRIIESLNY